MICYFRKLAARMYLSNVYFLIMCGRITSHILICELYWTSRPYKLGSLYLILHFDQTISCIYSTLLMVRSTLLKHFSGILSNRQKRSKSSVLNIVFTQVSIKITKRKIVAKLNSAISKKNSCLCLPARRII